MQNEFTPDEIERMAQRAGLVIPPEDFPAVARALNAHMKRVEPLLALELNEVEPAVTFDPSWRD